MMNHTEESRVEVQRNSLHGIKIAGYSDQEYSNPSDVVGQVCENTDYLARNILLPGVHIGDLAIILNAGAYVSSMASNYNLQSC